MQNHKSADNRIQFLRLLLIQGLARLQFILQGSDILNGLAGIMDDPVHFRIGPLQMLLVILLELNNLIRPFLVQSVYLVALFIQSRSKILCLLLELLSQL